MDRVWRGPGTCLALKALGTGAAHPRGAWEGLAGAYILSAETLDEVGIGLDVTCQLLLLLCGLEDEAPLAEADDVLLHQVQVDNLHELLGGRASGDA